MLKHLIKTRLCLCFTKTVFAFALSFVFSALSWGLFYPELSLAFDQGLQEISFNSGGEVILFPYDSQGQILLSRRMELQPVGQERERWESLTPEKRQELRRRMERYRELSPEDQELFRRRYKQWQDISPDERQRMRENLKDWDALSPQERDQIRQRFRRP